MNGEGDYSCLVSSSNVESLAPGMSDLCLAVSGDRRPPAYWRWCCVENPCGGSATCVWVRDGRVVGMVANVYMPFVLSGQRKVGALVGDLRIRPSERSWSRYVGMLSSCGPQAVSDGVVFGYAIVPGRMVPLVAKLGALSLGRLPVCAGFLNIAPLIRGRGLPRLLSGVGKVAEPFVRVKERVLPGGDRESREMTGRFDASFDELWGSVSTGRPVAVVRDAAYLNWRYVDCPGRCYRRIAAFGGGKLQGLAVIRCKTQRRAAYLLELYARGDDPCTLSALLDSAVQLAATEQMGLVTACFPAGSAEERALRRMGFQSWAKHLWNVHLLVITDPAAPPSPVLGLPNWHFSMGDWLTH